MSDRKTNAGTFDALAELREIERLRALEEDQRRQREAQEQAAARAAEDEARRVALEEAARRQREVESMRHTLESLRQQIQDGAIGGGRVTPSAAPRRPWIPAAWIASVGAAAVLGLLAAHPSASEVRIAPASPSVEIVAPARLAPSQPPGTPPIASASPIGSTSSAPVGNASSGKHPHVKPDGDHRPPKAPGPPKPPTTTTTTPTDDEDPLFGADLDEKPAGGAKGPPKHRRSSR